jgi:hypothetical protein
LSLILLLIVSLPKVIDFFCIADGGGLKQVFSKLTSLVISLG